MIKVSFKQRLILSYFFLATGVAAFFFAAFYFKTLSGVRQQIRADLKNVASLGTSLVRAEHVAQVSLKAGCEGDPKRVELIRRLKQIASVDTKIDDAYVLIPGSQPHIFHFVANANQEVSPTACGEPYDVSVFPEILNAVRAPSADRRVTRDKWGEWFSGYAPIRDPQGQFVGILGVDMPARIMAELRAAFLAYFAVTVLLALFFSVLAGLLASQWLVRPLERIIEGMARVRDGDWNHTLVETPQQEFRRIAQIFNGMTAALRDSMKKLEQTVSERERINRELEIAADLQRRALPEMCTEKGGLDIWAQSLPAREVGGDYYDILTCRDGGVGFVIADAAGKGFSGSLFMTNSRSIFRVVSRDAVSPSAALKRTNTLIVEEPSSSKGYFITFLYAFYKPSSRRFTVANAGHYPPLIFSAKDRTFHSPGAAGLPLGIEDDQDFPEESVDLSPGDVVLLYTDGLIEAVNPKGDFFGLTHAMREIEEASGSPAAEIVRRIDSAMRRFTQDQPPADDVTLLVFKVMK